jgi:hypothetical protein
MSSDWLSSNDSCPAGIGLGAPPCDCTSWTWQLRPFPSDYQGLPELTPDRSVSPPVASVTVGQRLQVVLTITDEQPRGCNQGYGGGTVRSTDPSVLAFEGNGNHSSWRIFLAQAPGTASLEAVDLRTPSGGRTQIPLTVCRQPEGPNDCPNRAPLLIRVVP